MTLGYGSVRKSNPTSLLFLERAYGDDNSSKNVMGLGLAVCQSLVKALNRNRPGRDIKVERQLGKGSRFFFAVLVDDEKIYNRKKLRVH